MHAGINTLTTIEYSHGWGVAPSTQQSTLLLIEGAACINCQLTHANLQIVPFA